MRLFGKPKEEAKQPETKPTEAKTETKEITAEETQKPRLELPPLKPPRPERLPPGSPPLFIKIDKYREVLKNIRNLRSYILNLRDALDVLEDMQKELANGIHIAQRTLDELNIILSSLDSLFLKPRAIEHEEIEEKEEEAYKPQHPEAPRPKEVESYVRDVYSELEKLRNQLKSLS